MKRYDYIQFGALSILSHIAQGAAFILLFAAFGGTGSTSSFTFATPVGLALGVVYVSALSFLFGWGLRPDRGIDKNRCWNAAIVLYVLNLASLLVMPVPFGSGSILALYTGAHPQREKACQIRRQRKFSRIFRRCGSGHNK